MAKRSARKSFGKSNTRSIARSSDPFSNLSPVSSCGTCSGASAVLPSFFLGYWEEALLGAERKGEDEEGEERLDE